MGKQTDNRAIQAWIQLHRTQRHLLEQVEKTMKQAGLPPLAWYDILLELRREKHTGLRQYEIGDKILLSKHNLSRLLDRLEQKQLVRRHECANDARGNVIKITPNGEKLLKQTWPVYSQAIRDNFTEKLTANDMIELDRLLRKLVPK